jgi:hypothetical protein
MKALLNPRVTPQTTWSIPWRRAELGGMNGHGNARCIAAAQSVLADGGAYGKRLLSDGGRQQLLRNEIYGIDLVLGIPVRWGLLSPSRPRVAISRPSATRDSTAIMISQ